MIVGGKGEGGQICVTSFMSGPFVNLTPGEDKLLMINKQDKLKMIDDHQFIEKVNQCCIFLQVFGCCTLRTLVKICIFKFFLLNLIQNLAKIWVYKFAPKQRSKVKGQRSKVKKQQKLRFRSAFGITQSKP